MKNRFQKVSVVGLGYIGLPTAAMLASRGVDVVGVDINQRAVDTINEGRIHFVEPELDVVVQGVVHSGRLRATTKPEAAEVFVIAVPTPFRDNYQPDLSYVEAAIRSIAPVLSKGNLVILESTSPVGTTEMMCQWILEERPEFKLPCGENSGQDLFLAYCPERVLPGKVIKELSENDRVVGGLTPACAERAVDLYKIFVDGEIVITNAKTAEMVKLTENAFRDVNIAFANEVSEICDSLGINPWELISLANRHPRVNILNPGPGVGGHCISIDPWFIVARNPEQARLIRTARQVNDSKPHFVIEKAKAEIKRLGARKVACLGLAFKANIDDLRESPAVEITAELAKTSGVMVLAAEPYVSQLPESLSDFKNLELVDAKTAVREADVVVLLVDHTQFKELPRELIKGKTVIDTRGIWQ